MALWRRERDGDREKHKKRKKEKEESLLGYSKSWVTEKNYLQKSSPVNAHISKKYLLSNLYVSGAPLGPGNRALGIRDSSMCFHGTSILLGIKQLENENK